MENLRALVYGNDLSVYKKMLARREFEELEKKLNLICNCCDKKVSEDDIICVKCADDR